jgi:hypothetical protein
MRRRLSSLVDRLRRLVPGASLAREARREQVLMGEIGRSERAVGWVRAKGSAIFETSRYAFFWILFVGLAGIFLFPFDVRRLSRFEGATDTTEFLRTLWQVEASALALSIAVIIFAFQVVSSSGYGIKLYEFAEDVHLFPVFYVGIVGLVVDGLVLLGFGNGAPAGSAASWAIIVSGSSFPLLALLFTNTVRVLDPEELHRRRLVRMRQEVSRAVEREITERIALNLLEHQCEEAGIEFSPFPLASPAPDSEEITAPWNGYVDDIDTRKLASLADGDVSSVKLFVYVGARVAEGQAVLVLPSSATEKKLRQGRKVVRIVEDVG